MKKINLIIALVGIAGNLLAQRFQERNPGSFSGIKASGVFNITVTQEANSSVKVITDEDGQQKVITEVKNGVLEVYSQKNADGVTVNISTPTLDFIEVNGVVELVGANTINTDNLIIKAEGPSEVELDVKSKAIKTNNSGASSIRLKGSANQLIAETSGASNLKAYKLIADTVSVTASGASSARVNALSKITVEASGASSVNYMGTAMVKAIEKSGAASVNYREGTDEADNRKNDTTRLRFGTNKVIIISEEGKEQGKKHEKRKIRSNNFKHWSGVDLSVNGYLNADRKINMRNSYSYMELNYGKSFGFGLNIWEKDIHLYRNNLNIVTGFGFDFNNYSFSNKIKLNPDTSFISAINTPTLNYSKNRLKTFFLNVPVLLELNTGSNPKKSFHIASGVILGYKLRSRTKQSYILDGYKYEINRDADFNINSLRASATVRIGYGKFTLFGSLALNQLFQTNKGPELYPFTAGVSLISW